MPEEELDTVELVVLCFLIENMIMRMKLVKKKKNPSFEIFCSSEWMWVKLHKAHQQSVIILLHTAELHQRLAPVGGFI